MNELQSVNIISLQETPEESTHDFCPQSFNDYLGQEELKTKLKIYTQAAKERQEALDHFLLFGPTGLGKTTLSQIMAHEMGVNIKICSGPMIERTGDLVAILSGLQLRDILFIDEIHRMPTAVEEVLYSAMEQFRVDIIIGQGAGAKSVSLPIHPFTLIGATTMSGKISAPLRSRFGITERLEYYTPQELQQIVMQTASFLQFDLDDDAALIIGSCARGTPRIAKKIIRRMRDFAQVQNKKANAQLAKEVLQFLQIDEEGLTKIDTQLLYNIIDHFNGGPVGLDTIASMLGEDPETLERVYEPFLIRKGYLEKTSRGRQIPHKILPKLAQRYKLFEQK